MMGKRPARLLALATITASTLLFGCTKDERKAAPAESSLPATVRASIDTAVSAYEDIRVALADDRSNVRMQALTLAGAAEVASESAPPTLRQPLDDLAVSSRGLAAIADGDLSQARTSFGDVSRALIAVLSAEPSLQPGRRVYECPMAKGYKKWVQLDDTISNPYMGSTMLQCGSEAEF